MSITLVTASYFKCFKNLALPIKALTLLTGYNAAGKSSSMQPLLLLSQNRRSVNGKIALELNGPFVRLGNVGDVLNSAATSAHISFGLSSSNGARATWKLSGADGTANRALAIESFDIELDISKKKSSGSAELSPISNLLDSLIYISALRLGLTETFPVPDTKGANIDVGTMGEFAPWWYSQCADDEVEASRRHPAEIGTTLRRQLDAYFNDLFPSAQANAEVIPRADLVRLSFRTGSQSDWLKPANVGFGLTYLFPILVALLLVKQGQIIYIDSPEAHLHPQGQSVMGQILAVVANSGVQVILETHSDHVLNGVRLAVKRRQIDPHRVAVHFFSKSGGDDLEIITPKLKADGALDGWPSGFFDQSDRDLMKLTGLIT